MHELKKTFHTEIQNLQKDIKKLLAEKGEVELGSISIQHLFRGLRGLPLAYTPTSFVSSQQGVFYRGKPIMEVHKLLPRYSNTTQPSVEALFSYFLTGKIPTLKEVETLRTTLHAVAHVPHHAFNVIDALPKRSRPMTRFCIGVLACTPSAIFQDQYDSGIQKSDHWQYAFVDAINLIAKLPFIASYVYTKYCKHTDYKDPDHTLDWGGNLAHMMGYTDTETQDLIRLYLFTHAEHGATNVSAHTARLVSSSLANVFYTYTASMLGLSGPLHGHANEQTVKWLLTLIKKAHSINREPTDTEFLQNYVVQCLDNKQVIPGYGHAALRVEDPRFTMFYQLIEKQGTSSEIIEVVRRLYKIVPKILKEHGKAANINPNIDAITGSVLQTKGIVEHNFYTVFFGISRLIGIAAQYIIDRALQVPLERPVTLSNDIFTL